MTIETKRKILWWVKRVLNYCEYADSKPYIIMDAKRIVKITSVYRCPNQEVMMMSEEQRHYVLNTQLMDELEKNRVIKYSSIPTREHINFYAEFNVLMS